MERARLLIEQAEALGEPPEDPLLLFSVLYGFWVAKYSRSTAMRCSSSRRSSWPSPRDKGATVPLMMGHRLMGTSLLLYGRIAEGLAHSTRRSRFMILPSIARWRRGSAKTQGDDLVIARGPCGRLAIPRRRCGCEHALNEAREIGQAATLMYALNFTSRPYISVRKLRDSKRCK